MLLPPPPRLEEDCLASLGRSAWLEGLGRLFSASDADVCTWVERREEAREVGLDTREDGGRASSDACQGQ